MPVTTLECHACGKEVGPEDTVCSSCGSRLLGRGRAPAVWGTPRARRVAAAAGLLIALVLAVALGWFIFRDLRGDPEPPGPNPAHVPDR